MNELTNQAATELQKLIGRFGPELVQLKDAEIAKRSRPKKWARKEVLGHLIDSACNNHQKFVRMMAEPQLEFVGYQQDVWVDVQVYAKADWIVMVDLWRAYNLHIAHLIEIANETQLEHTIQIDDVGPFTLEFIMTDYVEHLKHHLNQIFPDADLKSGFENVYKS